MKNHPDTAYGALCEAIFVFNRAMDRQQLNHSLVIYLDPPAFKEVAMTADPIMGSTLNPDGNMRVMNAIIIPKRLTP